jgi:NADPH-dependent 2,4-dienoyl-CoA reductase/sulfur reductase-like enzyme/nitrite reductase/ring-hydroxylating ferredoxin subunit
VEERVAGVDDLADGQMMTVLVSGKKTLLVRVGGQYFATAARCPHWGAALDEGLLHGPRLLCPLHKSTFDVRDGSLIEPPALDGLRAFRVRVAGDDVCIDRDEGPAGFAAAGCAPETTADGRTFAIVGGGAVAAAAIEALREECFTGRLVLITPEDRWPYDRPNLSKDFLTDHVEAKWLPLRPPAHYDELRVERLVGSVVELDVNSRMLTLDDGTTLVPDGVLLASGARPRRLNVPGADLEGVFTLRSWSDAERLVAAARLARRAVVIGASFIGMEVAAGLRERGVDVTVVGPEKVPFEAALGVDVGGVVLAFHEERGTRFALERGVARIVGLGRAEGVELSDGTVLDADLVAIGVGVQPVTEFVRGAELDRDGGVPVDDQFRVAPGIWAAGDIARYREPHTGRDVRIEHWRLAEQQGRAAARSMAGRGEPFRGVPFFWTQHFDFRLGYAGAGRGWEGVFVVGDLAARDFTAFYHAGDELLAACGTQDDELAAFLELMEGGGLPAADAVRGRSKADLPRLLR